MYSGSLRQTSPDMHASRNMAREVSAESSLPLITPCDICIAADSSYDFLFDEMRRIFCWARDSEELCEDWTTVSVRQHQQTETRRSKQTRE